MSPRSKAKQTCRQNAEAASYPTGCCGGRRGTSAGSASQTPGPRPCRPTPRREKWPGRRACSSEACVGRGRR
eukprot:2312614-Rhodomonas_salina.7